MSWRRIKVACPEEASVCVQDLLLYEGALGLEIIDDETRCIPEKPFTAEHQAMVIGTFEHRQNLDEQLSQRLSSELEEQGFTAEWSFEDLLDGDWETAFLTSWKTFSLGHDIWIVPSWEQEKFKAPHPESMLLYMDPGMAFGTGQHETTQLCAKGVFEALRPISDRLHYRVLDVGTGTGILAMIAAKLGVGEVVGTDIDPLACKVARENCQKNKLDWIEVIEDKPDFKGPHFNLVVANILANPLIEMVSLIKGALRPGGALLLSGILREQETRVREAYQAAGFTHQRTRTLGDWVLIELGL